jgi:hypothetical protein
VNPIFAAALEVEVACRADRFDFCFIGGLAVQRWGEPRMTAVVELTLMTGFGTEEPFVDTLLARFSGRIPDARDFALRHRTLLLVTSGGIHIDISLGAMPFEERTVARASAFAVSATESVTTCSAEDLVVHEAFAARDQDWLDIRGIAVRQGSGLDQALIWTELTPLLELQDRPGTAPRLRALFIEAIG